MSTIHQHQNHELTQGSGENASILCPKMSAILELLGNRQFLLAVLMPLGSILLGLTVAAVSNWANNGRIL